MSPDISEFSYGFALTNELIDLAGTPLRAAPVFPTLVEEGRTGGGYDVHMDIPGFPLFLQFKRADCMRRSNAKELQSGLYISIPFYRMKITERSRSDQHELLLALDHHPNEVFYAAPLFHRIEELNSAYLSRKVADRSFYIRPRDIGSLDHQAHHIAFDATRYYVCSEPREVKGIRGNLLPAELERRLSRDDRSFRKGPLVESLNSVRKALRENHIPERQSDLGRPDKTEEERQLRTLADLALRYFGSQLFVVQRADSQQ